MRIILILLILTPVLSFSQTKIDDFKGIYQHTRDKNIYIVINGFDVVNISFDAEGCSDLNNCYFQYYLSELFFLKEYNIEREVLFDSLMTQNIEESCGVLFFYSKKSEWRYKNRKVSDRGDIDGIDNMSFYELYPEGMLVLTNVNMHTYGLRNKLPKGALTMLYHKGQIDGRDYIRHFLELDVRAIASEKATIYDSTGTVTKMYLIKDDIISVSGQQNGFVQMEYETDKGRIIKGMVKKEDIATKTDSRLIKVEQSTIYNTPGGEPTGQHFDKKRKVIIAAYDGEWFEVKDINNEDKSGWIKKSDTAFEVLF